MAVSPRQNQVLSAIVFLYSQVLGLELDWLTGIDQLYDQSWHPYGRRTEH